MGSMIYNKEKYDKVAKMIRKIENNHPFFAISKEEDSRKLYKSIPVIYKKNIRENYREYISKEFISDFEEEKDLVSFLEDVKELSSNHDRICYGRSGKKWILETTTGSTGKPFTVVKDSWEKLQESKYLMDQRKKIYKDTNLKNGFLLLQPFDNNIKSISYRGNTAENMPLIIEYMLGNKPKWLLLTVLLLRKMVSCIREMGIENKIRNLNLKFIETTSQTITNYEKEDIQKIFGCPIVNQFGCREVWNIAYECPLGHMHVNDKYLLVDIVDQKGNIVDNYNKEGEVIFTSFLHTNFPFIKYYLGDYAYFSGVRCECGNLSPVIVFSGGRQKDKLLGTNFYGTEIFRKVMRLIYFKHQELKVKDIFIYQKSERVLDVTVSLNQGNEEKFEMIFQKTFVFLVKENNFLFNYIYTDTIASSESDEKPEIFKNYYAKV